jgi:peptide/nickel transport system permease protein
MARSLNGPLTVGTGLLGLLLLLLLLMQVGGRTSTDLNLACRLEAPSARFPLGTDPLGRDLLACLGKGAVASLLLALVVTAISLFVGTVLGLAAGYGGGRIDSAIMHGTDIMLAFPGFLLALLVLALAGSGTVSLIVALCLNGWAGPARLARAGSQQACQADFIRAARACNASPARIVFTHLLPLQIPLLQAQAGAGIAQTIMAESTLSFLGLGFDPRLPTLGQIIDVGCGHLFDAPRLVIGPGVVLFWLILSFTLIGEGLQERTRERQAHQL